VGCQLRGDKPT